MKPLKSVAITPAPPPDPNGDAVRDILAEPNPKLFLDGIAKLATRECYADAARILEIAAMPLADYPSGNRNLVECLAEPGVNISLRLFRVALSLGVVQVYRPLPNGIGEQIAESRFTLADLTKLATKRNKSRRAWLALAALGYVRSAGILPDDPREKAALALGLLVRAFFYGERIGAIRLGAP